MEKKVTIHESSKVSVIVPVYNVELYLPQCIDDLLAQSYKNLEIILVNDGSSDASGEICSSYSKRDTRIIVIHQENTGVSAARNRGLDRATGDYISFVDSDDRIDPHFIELMLAHISGSDLLFCSYQLFEDSGGEPIFHSTIPQSTYTTTISDPLGLIAETNQILYIVPWNKLYSKHLFDRVRYPIGKIHEDEYIIHDLFSQVDSVIFLDSPLYYYRRRLGSITSNEANSKGYRYKTEAIYQRRNYFLSIDRLSDYIKLNTVLLNRLARPTIRDDDPVWKSFSFWDIFRNNNANILVRTLLVLKKCSYPVYQWLIRNSKRFVKHSYLTG